MKALVGQYECAHRSGLGMDYFTAKLDRLTLFATGRFTFITQEKSRIMHAAKSLASGQQASMEAPEMRREGTYSAQGDLVFLQFDDGTQQRAQLQDEGLQIGNDYFEKVSDSTFMPPPQRMKSNMEDIAKGLKIAGAIGGSVLKAARTIQDTLQTQPAQNQPGTGQPQASTPGTQQTPPAQNQPASPPPAAPSYSTPSSEETFFCDQCGSPVRPGKRFCNKCGARLP
ncbi:MAG TPA: zinc ribbon domain-containing protein [Ktedonobacteraceae bacterium]|nr:zinc ribbon domain-containing protein [Ktedonobacteraceae bacterium]